MAKQDSKPSLARILVPLVVGLVGFLMVLSLMNPSDKEPAAEDEATTAQTPTDKTDGSDDEAAEGDSSQGEDPEQPTTEDDDGSGQPEEENEDAGTDEPDEDTEPATAAVGPLDNLRPLFDDKVADLDEPGDLLTLGNPDPETGYNISARINPYRASIYDLIMVNEYHKVDRKNQYKLLSPISFDELNPSGEKVANFPEAGTYAASYLTINGQRRSGAE
ncbi:MAG: hypothetical protein AAF085_14715, partial [Planctomycetota bacterium]